MTLIVLRQKKIILKDLEKYKLKSEKPVVKNESISSTWEVVKSCITVFECTELVEVAEDTYVLSVQAWDVHK
jgi:hypothetical protein